MPYCTHCGGLVADEVRFCPACGNRVEGSSGHSPLPPVQSNTDTSLRNAPAPAPCRYHPQASVVGACVDCHKNFCQQCEVQIIRHGSVCLDCGTQFALRKLKQAHIATGVGFAFGAVISFMFAGSGQWLMALWPPLVYAYFFPAVFFGWHYGGKIWVRLFNFADHFTGFAGLIASVVMLAVRITFSIYAGVFGGGIVQYLRYRKIAQEQRTLLAATQPAAASV